MGDFIKKYEFVLVFFMGLTYYLYDFYFSTDEFDPTNIGLVLIGIGMIGFAKKQLFNHRKEVKSRFMGKLKVYLKKVMDNLFFVLFYLMYFDMTDYGKRPFKEGFIEMTTDPFFYYIIIGLVGVGVIVYYVDKMMKKIKR